MDSSRFDTWTRRRFGLVAGGMAALLGLAAGLPGPAGAKNNNKPNKRKLKVNTFGCVNVGGKCRGRDRNCCSGSCQGKKPKKGEKDKSRCVAHHVGGCQADQDVCRVGPPPQCGTDGRCFQTTGNASFCGVSQADLFNPCTACKKDADCTPEFGPGAACVVCAGECLAPGTACISAAV